MTPDTDIDVVVQLLRTSRPILEALPRIGSAILVLPLLPRELVPRRLKAAFTLAMCLVAYPMLKNTFPTGDWEFAQWAAYVFKESLIGALVGYTMGVVIWALGSIGELIDIQSGFNNAKIFDPFSALPAGPLSALMNQLGVLLFVSAGGLHVFLQLLYESLILWPPQSFYPDLSVALRDFVIGTSGTVLELATRLAAPVIGALLIVELGIGLINRVAPQLNSFYFSMPIKALAALLMLALLLSHLTDVVQDHFVKMQNILPELTRSLKGP